MEISWEQCQRDFIEQEMDEATIKHDFMEQELKAIKNRLAQIKTETDTRIRKEKNLLVLQMVSYSNVVDFLLKNLPSGMPDEIRQNLNLKLRDAGLPAI